MNNILGTLLDKLGSLFSKDFVVSTMPLLVFLFLHGLVAYLSLYDVQRWVDRLATLDATQGVGMGVALLLFLAVLSYVLSSLSELEREILEGRLFPQWLSNMLAQPYRNRLRTIEDRLAEARGQVRTLRIMQAGKMAEMAEAYRAERKTHVCNYARRKELSLLFDLRLSNEFIDSLAIQGEVEHMIGVLKGNSPEKMDSPASKNLDGDYTKLIQLIHYATDKWEAQVVKYLNKIGFEFAGKDVAPTMMGNISRVAPYYAATRYGMNLDVFWTRLQKVLQADTSFYPLIQQAKRQLDFLVSLFWQTLVFTALWVVLLPLFTDASSLFLVIGIAGPLLTYVWYRIAVRNYIALADLLRAAVDLYRLDLLKGLHFKTDEDERALWEKLEQHIAYGDTTNAGKVHIDATEVHFAYYDAATTKCQSTYYSKL